MGILQIRCRYLDAITTVFIFVTLGRQQPVPPVDNCDSTQVSRGRGISYNFALRISKITQPSSRVELCNDLIDLPFLRTYAKTTTLSFRCRLHGSDANTLNRQRALSGEPSNDDGVTGVPEVQNLERDRRLSSLSGEEVGFGREGQGAELEFISILDSLYLLDDLVLTSLACNPGS